MNKKEKANEIYSLLAQAWVLAYKYEKESEGEEKGIFREIGFTINRAQCECHPLMKGDK